MREVSRFPDGDLGEAAELGAVTDRSVRVWVRQPETESVSLRLEVAGRKPVTAGLPLTAERDWAGAIELALPEPAPGEPFTIRCGERTLHARFAPTPGDHTGFTFAFGSCHYPFAVDESGKVRLRAATRIYPALRDDLLAAETRFLLLIGDQLYADAVPPVSVRDELPGDADHPPPLDLLVNAYRKVTRGYFAERGFRSIREALPTLCMWDDHDIFNNWGSLQTESPLDRQLFTAASQAFSGYQDARNPGGGHREPPFDFFYQFGTAGFLVLDVRGARSYEEGRLFGRKQWDRFLAFLRSEAASRLHTLFVVISVPVNHGSRWLTTLFDWLPFHYGNDIRDRWTSTEFRSSRDEFLDALFAWQDTAPYRQVYLLCGDIHEAEASAIRRRNRGGTIWQFTSSALTSPPTPQLRRLNWIATRFPNLLEPTFRFDRLFLLPRNNAGVIRLDPRSEGGHTVRYTVRAWDHRHRRLFDAKIVTVTPSS